MRQTRQFRPTRQTRPNRNTRPNALTQHTPFTLAVLLQLGSLAAQAQTQAQTQTQGGLSDSSLLAQAHPREQPTARVEVTGHYDNAVGTSDAASQGSIRAELLKARPALRPGEVLELVPGMVVTQHSGDGKANQYFLRGFNLDHGTDFSIQLDGMPINLPTHAHGQGYSDLNFLIPELVSGVRYRKGPYSVDAGDFSLAGSAHINYVSTLAQPFAQFTLGPNNYQRSLIAGSRSDDDQTWLGAFELVGNDGPWQNAEGLRKFNAVLRYTQGTRSQGWNVTAMAYDSRWNATDQIPQRSIDDGTLSRFGPI